MQQQLGRTSFEVVVLEIVNVDVVAHDICAIVKGATGPRRHPPCAGPLSAATDH